MEYIITKAKPMVDAYIQADIPVFLWGAPGIGKSDLCRQLAKERGIPLFDFRAALRDPTDIRGLPHISDGKAVWLPPSDLPDRKRDGEFGILLLDELNAASQAVQVACFQLVLDRRVGDYVLPEGWRILAAGNRQSDRASAQRLSSALASRFAHVELKPDAKAWIVWAEKNGIDPRIVAFLEFRPEYIHVMPATDAKAFPTPRTWERVNRVINSPKEYRFGVFAGLLGEAVTGEFCGFLDIYENMPSIREILASPETAKIPRESEATMSAVASALGRMAERKNVSAIGKYAARMGGEYEFLVWHNITRQDVSLKETHAYVDFAKRDSEIEFN